MNIMTVSQLDDISEHLPDRVGGVAILNVETAKGLGQLRILRQQDDSFVLFVYKPNENGQLERTWQSPPLPAAAINAVWSLCWTHPLDKSGVLP